MTQHALKPIPQPSDYARAERLKLGLRPMLLVALLVAFGALFLLSLTIGSVSIPLEQVVTVLLGGEADKRSWTNIVMKFRLPKALTASLAGAGLGVSGLMMQTFFRNPLAGPFVLGISAGASLGVAVVVLSTGTVGGILIAGMGLTGDLAITGAAALGGALSMGVVLLVAGRVRNSMTLLIVGLMLSYLVSALVSLLLHFAIPERITAYINWTFGSFGGVTWSQMSILAGAIGIGLLLALSQIKALNALLLGETYARSLGLNVPRTRLMLVGSTAILAGAVTAFCGPIGFIGVAVPHLCRSLFNTSDHRLLVPACILMGAMTALTAALIAEMPTQDFVLPLNAVTALIGAPIVMLVILGQRNLGEAFGA